MPSNDEFPVAERWVNCRTVVVIWKFAGGFKVYALEHGVLWDYSRVDYCNSYSRSCRIPPSDK